jgi:hypothetical protein
MDKREEQRQLVSCHTKLLKSDFLSKMELNVFTAFSCNTTQLVWTFNGHYLKPALNYHVKFDEPTNEQDKSYNSQ